jgi:hypothetical protein
MKQIHGWIVGNNMPGYMPDEPPSRVETFAEAIAALRDDIRCTDEAMNPEGENESELRTAYAAVDGLEAQGAAGAMVETGVHLAGRWHWIAPDTEAKPKRFYLAEVTSELQAWRKGPPARPEGWKDTPESGAATVAGEQGFFSAIRDRLTVGRVRLEPRGAGAAQLDIELTEKVGTVEPGPVAKVYLNEYTRHGITGERLAIAVALANAALELTEAAD